MKKNKAIFMLMVMLMSTLTQFATSVEAITAFSNNPTSDFTMSSTATPLKSSVAEMNQVVTQIDNSTFFEEGDSNDVTSSSIETRATGQDITKYDSASSLPKDKEGNPTIMKLDKMEVKDAAGNVVPVDDGRPLKNGETFTIYYTFEIPNEMGQDIKDGDYFDFQLPTNEFIYLPKAQDGELKGPGGQKYGTFHADTDGKVRLTFENFEQGAFQDVSGTLYFSLGVDTKDIKHPGGYNVTVPNVSGKDDVIIWIAGDTQSYVQKKHTGFDGEDPTWEILINPNSLPLKDVTLKDTTTQNNSNAIKGIEITKIVEATVDMDGNVTTGSEIHGYQPNADSNGYLDIGMTEINQPYVIYIKTPLNFGVQGEIINRIELSAKSTTGKDVGGTATASFDKTKVELIKKEGKYDKDKQEIEWTIVYNPSGLHIP